MGYGAHFGIVVELADRDEDLARRKMKEVVEAIKPVCHNIKFNDIEYTIRIDEEDDSMIGKACVRYIRQWGEYDNTNGPSILLQCGGGYTDFSGAQENLDFLRECADLLEEEGIEYREQVRGHHT